MLTHKNSILLSVLSYLLLSGCSIFAGTQNTLQDTAYTTIPLPPQKLNSSDEATPANPEQRKTPVSASAPKSSASQGYTNTYPQRIQEERSNGAVTEIKVDNKNLPDYYIYPQRQEAPVNNGNNISTPSWQINW